MVRLLTAASAPCAPASLCLFDTPGSQVAFTRGQDITFVPAFSTDNTGPYTFHVFDSTHFLKLNETYISFKLRLSSTDKDGAPVVGQVAPVNMIGCTFFNQIKVAINNVQLYDSTHYAYKAYLEAVFAPEETRKSLLSAAGFVDDDHSAPMSMQSPGFKGRVKLIQPDGTLEVCAPVFLEPFMTDNLLLPHINLQLTFYRNLDAFVLETGDDLKVKLSVSDMKLHVRAIEVNPAAALALENRLRATPARYPFTSCRVKQLTIPPGRLDLPFTLLTNDILPRKIIIGLLSPEAIEGSLSVSGFNFGHHNVSEMSIDAAGHVYPAQPYPINFKDGHTSVHLVKLLTNLGLASPGRSTSLSRASLLNGHCFWAFNLSPYPDSNAWELSLVSLFSAGVTMTTSLLSIAGEMPTVKTLCRMPRSRPGPLQQVLAIHGSVPNREAAVPPSATRCQTHLLTLMQLGGVASDSMQVAYLDELRRWLAGNNNRFLSAHNGFNGAPLRLPLSVDCHSAQSYRFFNDALPYKSTVSEYYLCWYGVRLVFRRAPLIIDASGTRVPIEAVTVVYRCPTNQGGPPPVEPHPSSVRAYLQAVSTAHHTPVRGL